MNDEPNTNIQRERDFMYHRLKVFSDLNLTIIWALLTNSYYEYNPKESYAPGIDMSDWARAVSEEMKKRDISHGTLDFDKYRKPHGF
jgi:hypothetical protein